MDFNFVSTRVATGAAITDDKDVQALIKAGITHIIDCRAEFDDLSLLKGYNITYLYNGVHDDGRPKPVSWFQHSIEFALEALLHPSNKIYAHCAAGVNRGPSTAYAILRALGLNSSQAESFIKAGRPIALIGYMKDADAAITALKYE
jgi:protein-tyrosine phosphatase